MPRSTSSLASYGSSHKFYFVFSLFFSLNCNWKKTDRLSHSHRSTRLPIALILLLLIFIVFLSFLRFMVNETYHG
jgi:hypothetical protein